MFFNFICQVTEHEFWCIRKIFNDISSLIEKYFYYKFFFFLKFFLERNKEKIITKEDFLRFFPVTVNIFFFFLQEIAK